MATIIEFASQQAPSQFDEAFVRSLECSPDAVVIAAADGTILLANQRTAEQFGYSREELLGKPIEDLIPQRFRQGHQQHRDEYAANPSIRRMGSGIEVLGLRRDGSEFPADISLSPIEVGHEKVVYAAIRDIQQQKEMELELAAYAARSRSFIENSRDPIWCLEFRRPISLDLPLDEQEEQYRSQGYLVEANQAFAQAVGYQRADQVIGKSLGEIRQRRGGKRDGIRHMVASQFRIRDFEAQWVDGDGNPIYFLTTTVAGMSGDRKVQRVWGVSRDVTERKRREEGLRKSRDEIRSLKERLEKDNRALEQQVRQVRSEEGMVGNSKAMLEVLTLAGQVAPTDSVVLVQGETGTGKELLARAIHKQSARSARPMVTINCAAIPSSLLESELFGREKGAYTGALSREVGRFELADGSTLLLDEVGEMPPEAQSKLLRVLETGRFERLGSSRTVKTDVRIIAATNRDLHAAVQQGQFRVDLFYRLNVFPITLPPLRERPEDISALAWRFVEEFCTRMGKRIDSIPQPFMERLQVHSWPGNVRELRNVIERAVILTQGRTLHVEDPRSSSSSVQSLELEEVQREHISKVLQLCDWRLSGPEGAAQVLGCPESTLRSRMKKLGIQRPV